MRISDGNGRGEIGQLILANHFILVPAIEGPTHDRGYMVDELSGKEAGDVQYANKSTYP